MSKLLITVQSHAISLIQRPQARGCYCFVIFLAKQAIFGKITSKRYKKREADTFNAASQTISCKTLLIYEQPVVVPQSRQTLQVPLRTMRVLEQVGQIEPS